MPTNKKQLEYNKKYDSKNMKSYTVKMQLSLYNKMLEHINAISSNQNAYTIQAIKEKLERDGMDISDNVQ
jgi:hypothetical protein